MNLTIALAAYAAAMTIANLSVATFGPSVTPINAFVLIGLDLALGCNYEIVWSKEDVNVWLEKVR